MKANLILGAVLVLGTLSACTVQMGLTTAAKGRVMVAASMAQKGVKARIAKPARIAGARSVGVAMRSAPSHQARDLAAATDISSMTYSLFDMDNNGAPAGSGPIDKSNPSLDLTLNPGTNYRIVVDVVITSSAPGYTVGVTHYGDQADFLVDPSYDTYVDLTIHPTQALVFDPASVSGGNIKAYDPVANSVSSLSFFSGTFTPSPADKLFLGPDSRLYYFNKASNSIFRWQDKKTAIQAIDPVLLTGTALSALTSIASLSILAACADPVTADALWVVAVDGTSKYYYFEVTTVSNQPAIADQCEITSDLTSMGSLTTVAVTGLAVDSTYSDVYVSYASTDTTTTIQTGILQYYYDTLEPYSIQLAFPSSSSSIFTDVVWDQGKAWALLSPNTTFGPGGAQGTAGLVAFDDFLTQLTVPAPSPALTLPNRFAGPIQGSLLYLDQVDFNAPPPPPQFSSDTLTSVNTDSGVTSTLYHYSPPL